MSIATEISRLQTAKADIKAAIEAKGVTVPNNVTLDTYDTYVSQISGGGGTNKFDSLVDGSITSVTETDLANVTTTKNYAFAYCTSLTQLNIPANISSIGKRAFAGCTALTTVTINSNNTGLTSLPEYAFSGCTTLTSFTFGPAIASLGEHCFYNTGLTSITLPSTIATLGIHTFSTTAATIAALVTLDLSQTNITTVPQSMVAYQSNLTTVKLPATVTKINSSAFIYTTSLTAIDFAGTKAQWNSINIASNWKNMSSLTTIHCSDGDITL